MRITTRKLESQEKIAGMKTDTTKRIQAIADTKYDGDTNKSTKRIRFLQLIKNTLIYNLNMDKKSVATDVIDSSGLQKKKDLKDL